MSDTPKLSKKAIETALRELGAEGHTVLPDGTPITRAQALAKILWQYALGYTVMEKDKDGKLVEKKHPPASWALQYVVERLEGKSAPVIQEAESGIRAAEKVRMLAKDRLNKIAESSV